MAESGVAQIFNLLYRRLAVGRVLGSRPRWKVGAACGLQIRDTADYKSALLNGSCDDDSFIRNGARASQGESRSIVQDWSASRV